ncbi:MAG: DNA primase [Kiritimatiellia bacterium]
MAQGIAESVVEEIKARTDLVELIASYGVQVRRAGAHFVACCPFHTEKTPSFHINPGKGFYHCFGCGESGDAISFAMKMDGLTFPEAARKLAEQQGIRIETREDPDAARRKRLYALMAELAQFYHRCLLRTKEAQFARDYLAARELDVRVQEDFLLGYAPQGAAVILTWAAKHGYTPAELEQAGVIKGPERPGDKGYHRFGGRLMFSIKDKQGRVVAFSGRLLVARKNAGKYVNSPETPIFRKSNVLFGFDRAAGNIVKAPHREVICCEGQIDTIRLHIHGFATAVASQGTAFTEEHAQMIRRVADAAILMYDDDAAGHKATIKVAGMLLAREMPVRVVSLPDGDDPDSFLRKNGREALQALIDGAESVVSFQCRVARAQEVNPQSIDAVARVAKAVLATLAACPSAILRARLVDEAAALLGLPVAALAEELDEKCKRENGKPRTAAASTSGRPHPDADDPPEAAHDAPHPGAPACRLSADVPPPPARERALMEFLMANEYDRTLADMVGEFLPAPVFVHPFTVRFVDVWREEAMADEDRFAAFAETLPAAERTWFDTILVGAGKTQASGLGATDILQEFVRALWIDGLRRRRGALPAKGDAEADAARVKISMDVKRLQQVKWNTVKEMVRAWAERR